MFRIRAALDQQVEWKTRAEAARAFFNDLRNFVELMPGVERITTDALGVARWLFSVQVPIVGSVRQTFSVIQSVDEPMRIEWSPAVGETKNFLRYSAAFEPRSATTLVHVVQRVELHRASARALHPLASLVSEDHLSAALQKVLGEMLQKFLQRGRTRLEESGERKPLGKGRSSKRARPPAAT
jgi:carbon monoxide dehydrogenase subunit G